MRDLDGKVILITGGTSGLGESAAKLLASRGARVAITGRREAQGETVVGAIKAAGGDAIYIKADVNARGDLEAMVAKTVARFGCLDGAVNNAGIAGAPFHAIADLPEDDWLAVINTNLTAVFMSMKFEIPAMLKSGGGSIVNMSSMYGLIGSDIGHGAYVAAKHGVIGLTKTAAIDYGQQGIRVNAVCPGYCHSEMVDPYVAAEPALFEKLLARHSAMNRLGESDEVAEAIAWLLSSKSSFINGAAIPIEGGETSRLY